MPQSVEKGVVLASFYDDVLHFRANNSLLGHSLRLDSGISLLYNEGWFAVGGVTF